MLCAIFIIDAYVTNYPLMKILRSTWLDSRNGYTVCLVLVKHDDGTYDARIRLVEDYLSPRYAKEQTAKEGTTFPLDAALVLFQLEDRPLPFDPELEAGLEAYDQITDTKG
jgi:hypothetical protein